VASERPADGALIARVGNGEIGVETVADSSPFGMQLVTVVDEELEVLVLTAMTEPRQPRFALDHASDGDGITRVALAPLAVASGFSCRQS